MVDFLIPFCGVLCGLAGFAGYFVGHHFQPRHKTLAETNKYYEEANQGLRKDIQRLRGRLSYAEQGYVPAAAVQQADSPEAVVEAVVSSLPPNMKMFILPFKGQLMQWAKENPDLVQTGIEVLKARMAKQQADNSQQGTEPNAKADYV